MTEKDKIADAGTASASSACSAATDLGAYIMRAETTEKVFRLRQQWASAVESHQIYCGCGQMRAIELAYRCLYCGEWYCARCAEIHFGKTVQQRIEERRVEARERLIRERQNPKLQ